MRYLRRGCSRTDYFLSDKEEMICAWRKLHNEGIVNCSIRVKNQGG
jgi:hypothetical protein